MANSNDKIVIKNAPEKIYLQVGEAIDLEPEEDFKSFDIENISWCADRIFSTDLEYVLVKPLAEDKIVYVPVSVDDEIPNDKRLTDSKENTIWLDDYWFKETLLSELLKEKMQEKDEQILFLKDALWKIAFADGMLEMADIANYTLQKHNSNETK